MGHLRTPYLIVKLLLPGAEDPQRETRSRGPSHRAGPTAMLSRALRKGSRDLRHVPRAGL